MALPLGLPLRGGVTAITAAKRQIFALCSCWERFRADQEKRALGRGMCEHGLRAQRVSEAGVWRRRRSHGLERFNIGSIADLPPVFQRENRRSPGGSRKFHIMPPVRMGRRAAKIATRKTAQDAKRSKQYGKLGKQIVSAVKQAGPNPATNPMLAAALTFAKQIGAPKELIDRNIKKASEKGQAEFTEVVYEVYALGGVGIVIEALTDNNSRAAATVRDAVKKGGAKMADPGSVLFNFKRCGVLAVPAESADGDELLEAAMDAGADDVLEPDAEDVEEGSAEAGVFKVVTSPETFSQVRGKLEEAQFVISNDLSGLELLPLDFVRPHEMSRLLNKDLIEKLLELDDVDAVYTNQL